jgi:putative transposase
MNATEFVTGIRKSIIDSNLKDYKTLFNNSSINEVKDPYWREALILYSKIKEDDKETFFKILRQVEVDTISIFLAVLDGISMMEGQESNLILTSDKEEQPLNGNLQDIFIEMEYK